METHKKKLNQNKLELLVALGFGLLIIGLSSTDIGYVPIGFGRSLDMAIIPAVFAAMIGGYRVGIPLAFIWSFFAYQNNGMGGDIFNFYGLVLIHLTLVTTAYAAYKVCKKRYLYSPANVYRAIFIAVTAKSIVSNVLVTFGMLCSRCMYDGGGWVLSTVQQYTMELALTSMAMMLLVKHLRQIHILNGVKRREKASKALRSKTSIPYHQEG